MRIAQCYLSFNWNVILLIRPLGTAGRSAQLAELCGVRMASELQTRRIVRLVSSSVQHAASLPLKRSKPPSLATGYGTPRMINVMLVAFADWHCSLWIAWWLAVVVVTQSSTPPNNFCMIWITLFFRLAQLIRFCVYIHLVLLEEMYNLVCSTTTNYTRSTTSKCTSCNLKKCVLSTASKNAHWVQLKNCARLV